METSGLGRELPRLLGIELLPYHRLAATKAGRMGLAGQKEFEPVSPEAADG